MPRYIPWYKIKVFKGVRRHIWLNDNHIDNAHLRRMRSILLKPYQCCHLHHNCYNCYLIPPNCHQQLIVASDRRHSARQHSTCHWLPILISSSSHPWQSVFIPANHCLHCNWCHHSCHLDQLSLSLSSTPLQSPSFLFGILLSLLSPSSHSSKT